jgi:hypothetical protein
MSTQYVVPLHEQEKGLPDKVAGYAGPFDTDAEACDWKLHYNHKNNPFMDEVIEELQPEWRIVAVSPEVYTDQNCTYEPLNDVYIPWDSDYELSSDEDEY